MVMHRIPITTDSAEAATKLVPIRGRILSITYVKVDFTNGVDFTITTETTLQNIWVDTDVNATETVHPRAAVHNSAGAALVYAATDPVTDYFHVDENLKIVIASGGAVKSGIFYINVDE